MSVPVAVLIERLDEVKHRFGVGDRALKRRLLTELVGRAVRRASSLLRFHEALCFMQAYPDDAATLAAVEAALTGVGDRVALILRDGPPAGAGALLSLYGLGSIGGAYLGGWLSDRVGARRVMGGSLVLGGAGFLALAALRSPAAIGAALVYLSVAGEAFRPAVSAAIVRAAPPEARTRAYALLRLAINLGMTIGPVAAGFLAQVDYVWLFVGDGGTCLLAAAVLAVLPQWFQPVDDYKLLLYGALLFAVMRLSPGGLKFVGHRLAVRLPRQQLHATALRTDRLRVNRDHLRMHRAPVAADGPAGAGGPARAPGATGDALYRDLVANARCAITLDAGAMARPYQGIIEVSGNELADSLQDYYRRSVQVPSHMQLVSERGSCGGILLQQLPGQGGMDADDWVRLGVLAATLRPADISEGVGADLLHKLFVEDDVRFFEPRSLEFHCRCSRKRAADVLRLLGEADTRSACEEQGQVEVTCEYCGRTRRFDAVDIARLFAGDEVPGSDRRH